MLKAISLPWLGLVAAAITAQAQVTAPGPVNTSSGRALIASATWPWQSIGRVNIAITTKRSMCTGTLVTRDKVLTAAHCLFDARLKDWVKPEDVRFVAGVSPGPKFADSSPVIRYMVSPTFRDRHEGEQPDFQQRTRPSLRPSESSMIAHDWAILTLQHALKLKPIPVYVPTTEERTAEIWAVLPGYGADRPYALSIARNCRVSFDQINLGPGSIAAPCQIAPGGSGSPILLLGDGTAKVVGVASSGSQVQQGAAMVGGTLKPSGTFFIALGAASSQFEEFSQ